MRRGFVCLGMTLCLASLAMALDACGCKESSCPDSFYCSNGGCVPKAAKCGDSVVDAGEECDDGNSQAADGCTALCKREVCGNSVLDPSEQCDDGNTDETDACFSNCTETSTTDPATPSGVCPAATGATLFVRADASGSPNGTPQRPYARIQAAVDAASDGTTIHVAAGIYKEAVSIENKAIVLCGGYDSVFSSAEPTTNVTIIQGTSSAPVVYYFQANASALVGFVIRGGAGGIESINWVSEGQSLLIDGNIIENNARPGWENNGGGIHISGGDVTISKNTIRNNIAGHGGGVSTGRVGSLTIVHNLVENNTGTTDHGGGLFLAADNATIHNNMIRGNELRSATVTYGVGGGLIFFQGGGTAHLSYNVYTQNYAPSEGSGVFIDEGATGYLDHELVYANLCSNGGGAVLADGGHYGTTHVTITNSTIADHPCTGWPGGFGLQLQERTSVTVRNCIFWNNGNDDFYVGSGTLDVSYTLTEEAVAGVGNIRADPLFANSAAGDYHLESQFGRYHLGSSGAEWVIDANTSPAIDSGDPSSSYTSETSPNGGRIDLGVYGNTSEASRSAKP